LINWGYFKLWNLSVEVRPIMNQFFVEPVIQDREREVATFAKYNRIGGYERESTENQSESPRNGKKVALFWISGLGKWLKGVLTIKRDDRVELLK
jgi:hypothetical protein